MSEKEPTEGIVASLILARYPPRAVCGALARMGLDRIRLPRTPGLRFWKLLGCARGRTFGPWEPRRYGLFAVWDSAAALEEFERRSPVMAAYRRRAEELWTGRLAPVRWHGAWGGVDPFAGAAPAASHAAGACAILTRATIRPSRLRAFRAAAAPADNNTGAEPNEPNEPNIIRVATISPESTTTTRGGPMSTTNSGSNFDSVEPTSHKRQQRSTSPRCPKRNSSIDTRLGNKQPTLDDLLGNKPPSIDDRLGLHSRLQKDTRDRRDYSRSSRHSGAAGPTSSPSRPIWCRLPLTQAHGAVLPDAPPLAKLGGLSSTTTRSSRPLA